MENYQYPTEEELGKIENWDILKQGIPDLVDYINSLWRLPDWGLRLYRGRSRLGRRSCMKLTLHTGGWAANEHIIGVLQMNHLFWALYWQKSTKGGHYWFEIPMKDWRRSL